jgi:hypothetical protein
MVGVPIDFMEQLVLLTGAARTQDDDTTPLAVVAALTATAVASLNAVLEPHDS